MATLVQEQTGQSFTPGARAVIGRGPASSLVLADPRVSGEHASLSWTAEGWSLRDLGSRNGTYVDGERVSPGEEVALGEGAEVSFGGPDQCWLLLDATPPATKPLPSTVEVAQEPPTPATIGLRIGVSSDQEYVEIDVVLPGRAERLAPRAYHDLILLLARERLAHRARGDRSRAEEGWVYFDDLCRDLGRERRIVNVEVYRARQQLADLGVEGAADLFERRAPTRQIRLGVADVAVEPL